MLHTQQLTHNVPYGAERVLSTPQCTALEEDRTPTHESERASLFVGQAYHTCRLRFSFDTCKDLKRIAFNRTGLKNSKPKDRFRQQKKRVARPETQKKGVSWSSIPPASYSGNEARPKNSFPFPLLLLLIGANETTVHQCS